MEILFRRHENALRGFIYRFAKNRFDADDIFQETVCKAFMHVKSFKGNSTFRTWLFGIAYNEFRQFQRKVGIFHRLKDAFTIFRSDIANEPLDPNVSIDFERVLEHLTEQEKTLVLLCDVEGFSHAEVAMITTMPLGTVKTIMRRVRQKLTAEFKDNVGDREDDV